MFVMHGRDWPFETVCVPFGVWLDDPNITVDRDSL